MTILADGQVATVQSVIFEVDQTSILPANVTIEKITFFNTNEIAQTAVLFLKSRFGVVRELRQFQLKENEGGEYLEPGEVLTIGIGDQLLAQTTTAAAVDFVVTGNRT